jgi:hypothetical protein
MVYRLWKNKSLYFSDLRFGLLNDKPENLNLLLAMNLLRIWIKSSWSPKAKGTESVYFYK